MLSRLSTLIVFVTELGVFPVYLLYLGMAKILPEILVVRGIHAWWHNLLIIMVWIGIYIAALIGMRAYTRQQVDLLIQRAWHNHEMKIFTGPLKWGSMVSVLSIVLVPYLKLPSWCFFITGGIGVAVIVYDIGKAKARAVFIVLQQIYLSLLTAVYFILFAPAIYTLALITFALMIFGIGAKDIFSPQIVVTKYFDADGRFVRSEKES